MLGDTGLRLVAPTSPSAASRPPSCSSTRGASFSGRAVAGRSLPRPEEKGGNRGRPEDLLRDTIEEALEPGAARSRQGDEIRPEHFGLSDDLLHRVSESHHRL